MPLRAGFPRRRIRACPEGGPQVGGEWVEGPILFLHGDSEGEGSAPRGYAAPVEMTG